MNKKVAWIIGASEGIGRSLSKFVSLDVDVLIVSARSVSRLEDLSLIIDPKVELVVAPCDFTSVDAVQEVVDNIYSNYAPTQIIFNVGAYEQVSIDNFNYQIVKDLYESNYVTAVNFLSSVLPYLKSHPSQVAFNISAASYVGLPYGGGYSAPKAALLNLIQSLKVDAERYGIDFRVINLGFVKTRLTKKNQFKMPFIIEPDEAAQGILRGLSSDAFEIHFPKRLTFLLKFLGILPSALFFKMMRRGVQ